MPVAFAQVREDSLIDVRVVRECSVEQGGRPLDVIQIASGGCTAAVLAAMPEVGRLHLVDPNPAQLALTRMKLWLTARRDAQERMAILGHVAMPVDARAQALRDLFAELGLHDDCLGSLAEVSRSGPDHAGRYELVFAALRQRLAPMATALHGLLLLDDVAEQRRRVETDAPLGAAIDDALKDVMALQHLVALFGTAATGNAALLFHAHFAGRIRHALATLPAATNPYLWQMLRGAYPPGRPVAWLEQPAQPRLASIITIAATMDQALADERQRFDVVHLSNILDWLSPDEAMRTLTLAWHALRPGGRVIIRQLNSTLDIPALGAAFAWDPAAAGLHAGDRSFFYRALHSGRRP